MTQIYLNGILMIEKNYDISFVSGIALREKQIQQNYRPIIAVHKWFARRPGTLFRSLLLSEFSEKPLQEAFYNSNFFENLLIADPFMGGGTPLIEANRIGCNVIGCDINPMSYWIVKQELEHLDLDKYQKAVTNLRQFLTKEIGPLYQTSCTKCGSGEAKIKYFLWVKTTECESCHKEFDLSPGYMVAENKRHPNFVIACKSCGELNEIPDKKLGYSCSHCQAELSFTGNVAKRTCFCPHCKEKNVFPKSKPEKPSHRLFAIEFYCPKCKTTHEGRFFKKPDKEDLAKYHQAEKRLKAASPKFIPHVSILSGDETDRLLRWGYKTYDEMFNSRQLLALELSCQFISKQKDPRVKYALATNLSDLLRYQNMLCRYDTMALKSLDIFSIHGFPVGLVQCESNFLGFSNGNNITVGSGGWLNITEKFFKAKSYCSKPFEIKHDNNRKQVIPVPGEWIGDNPKDKKSRNIQLFCESSTSISLSPQSLDGVFTDPPYFGNVQYAELMDFCYVWLKKLLGSEIGVFQLASTRNENELTGNVNMGRDLIHFTNGLSKTFQIYAEALKPGKPFAFTFHHNQLEAYIPVAVAILDAGLTCSVALPCPAEMGASIHINGTGSSIVDTVFVCRSTGTVPKRSLVESPEGLALLVGEDYQKLSKAYNPSQGDIKCILYGHLTRLAIWFSREKWAKKLPTKTKMDLISKFFKTMDTKAILAKLESVLKKIPAKQSWQAMEEPAPYGGAHFEISF